MKQLLIILLISTIIGCSKQQSPRQLDKDEVRQYVLLHKNPPKHFYVDLKDVLTGKIYNNVYVSKHCNSHRVTAIVGQVYSLRRIEYTKDGRTISEFDDLYQSFCRQ